MTNPHPMLHKILAFSFIINNFKFLKRCFYVYNLANMEDITVACEVATRGSNGQSRLSESSYLKDVRN